MPNLTFEVTIIDLWPKIKLLINQSGSVRTEGPYQYDIAASQFEPAMKEAMGKAVSSIIQQRKRSQ